MRRKNIYSAHYILFYEDNVYMTTVSNDNLGTTVFNMNQDIAQGTDFNKYKKGFATAIGNNHNLLQNTSSDKLGSINEAFTCDESTRKKGKIDTEMYISGDQQLFDAMLKDYANEQNLYNSSVMQKPACPCANARVKANALYEQRMNEQLNAMNAPLSTSVREGFTFTPTLEPDTMRGKIESSGLRMTSMYFHYMVYFFIAVTLLAFTFNVMVNPNASVTNAIIVVGALFLVYFFTRNSL